MKSPSKTQIILLYLSALFQGITFSLVPGAANFLMDKNWFGFSQYEYGNLFILMIFGAIFSSFFGARFLKHKTLFAFGLLLNAISMALFFLEHLFIKDLLFSYPIFLVLMFFLGSGLGATLSSLNYYAFQFFKKKQSVALTALHSFLGVGSALGPLFFVTFLKAGCWPAIPLFLSAFFLVLFILTIFLYTKESKTAFSVSKTPPLILILFCSFAILYGFIETTFGNWGSVLLFDTKHLSILAAAYALSFFWASITFFRIVFTFLLFKLNPKKVYLALAPTILLSLVLLHFAQGATENILIFVLAGLGCSAFLPLTFSFALKSTKNAAGYISGFYMAGYGFASWGVGALLKSGAISLSSVFLRVLIVPIALIILSSYLYKRKA
jgi:fucose permease